MVVTVGIGVGVTLALGETTIAGSRIGCPASARGLSSSTAAVAATPTSAPTTIEAVTMTAMRGTSPSLR